MNIKCINCNKEIKTTYKNRKYCCIKCQHEFQQKQWEEKWLSGEISGFHDTDHWGNIPDRIRNYLFRINNNKCSKCGYKYVPTNKQMLLSMHIGRTRYMKCPKCNKKSWNKKVIN